MGIEIGLINYSDCIFLLMYKSFKVTGISAAPNLDTVDKVWVDNCIINSCAETRFFENRRKNIALDTLLAIQLIWNLNLRRGSIKTPKNFIAGTVESAVTRVRFVISFSSGDRASLLLKI